MNTWNMNCVHFLKQACKHDKRDKRDIKPRGIQQWFKCLFSLPDQ
jgi:hypothetical protein